MDSLRVREEVKQALQAKGFETIKEIPIQTCDFAIRHPKFALFGFFRVFSAGRDLMEHWLEAQEEVRENLELHGRILNRHNTYLVFMLPLEELPPIRDVQPIISDGYVCRKLIAPIEDENIQKSLVRLPFYPFEIPELPKEARPKNVVDALVDSGLPHTLITDFAGRVSERTILRKLKESLYKHKQLEPQRSPEAAPSDGYLIHPTRIKKIWIKNFRGIGEKLPPVDMDADIIVIYGPNGTGKTSMIDAIEWTVTGEVERLWERNYDKPVNANESLLNLFSQRRFAEVQIQFDRNGQSILGRRCIDLSRSRGSYPEIDNKKVDNKKMIKEIAGIRMPRMDVRRLRKVFLRSHFLGQNTILEFIVTQKPKRRYDAFSHMVGTQDYILFADKIDAVIRALDRELAVTLEHKNELNEGVRNISAQVNKKKRAIQRLKRSVKEEVSTQKLANDMQILLQELNIEVPQFLFLRQKELAEAEELDKIAEIVSTYPPMASIKIDTLNNLLMKAKSEETRVQEMKKVISNMDELTRRMNELRKSYDSKESIVRVLQNELKEYSKQKASYDLQIINIKWVIETLPKYVRAQETLAAKRQQIKELLGERDSIQTKTKADKEKLSEVTSNLENSQKEIEDIEQISGYLSKIGDHLPLWRENLRKMSQITESIQQLNKGISQLQQKKSELEERLSSIANELKSIELRLDTEKEKQNRKLQLVTKLKEYLDSPECPFCGYNWGEVKNLAAQVEKQVLHLASIFHDLSHYDFKKPEDSEPLSKSLVVLASDHEKLLKKEGQIRSEIKRANKDIDLKLTRLTELGEEKNQLAREIAGWRNILVHLTDKHPELEERVIPSQIQVSKLLHNYQNRLDMQKANQTEIRRRAASLDKSIFKLENRHKEIVTLLATLQKKESDDIETLQQIDREMTKREVTNLISQDASALRASVDELLPKGDGMKKEMDRRRSECERTQADLSDMESNLTRLGRKQHSLDRRLRELKEASQAFATDLRKEGILPGKKLQDIMDELEDKKERQIEYFRKCEHLQSLSHQLKSIVTLSQIRHELDGMQQEKTKKKKLFSDIAIDYRNLSRWADDLKRLKRLAEEKRKEQEKSYFKMYGPAANLLYSRLNAHPLFDQIILKVGENELRVLAQLSKGESFRSRNADQISPRHFFSEAQLNIAALSIFLATALHQRWSRFGAIIIDDPVQNMDDFNVYAFLDLIRGLVMNGHQFILTTCNRDLYKLMLVKFRDLNQASQNLFKAYRLKGIYAEGPELVRDC